VDRYCDLVDAGTLPSPFDFADSLGPSFVAFLRAVEAKAALQAVIEPVAVLDPPRELGRYTLGRRLGQGACGAVYEALEEGSGNRVALKLIHPGLADQEAHVRRFRREARAGARLRHAHLVRIHEAGSVGARHYCVMQLVDGPTLRQRLKGGALPASPENIGQFAGIADGLATLHRAGIVHRDVKPQNTLIDADGRFLLGDFGLVRGVLETTITQGGEAVGTVGYMSPEQFERPADVDGRADIYALGATLYEAFSGRPAIEPGDFSSMLVAIQKLAPPDPRSVKPDLPPDLCAVIMTAMERRPEDRYQTAEALRDDLRRVAAGDTAVARPVSPLRRWARRNRRFVLVLASLATVLAGYAVHLATRPATLEVESHPPATLLVNGVARGRTPVRIELEPGTYDVALELTRFLPLRFRVTLEGGTNPKRTLTLLPEDATDRAAMFELAKSLGYEVDRFEAAASRGGGAFPLGRALLPCGRCRTQDLVSLRFETSDEEPFPLPARLVIRRGDEVLHERPIAELDLVAEFPFPADVRERLRPGDAIAWGVVTDSGREFLTEFEVVEETARLNAALARLDRDLAEAPPVRAFLRAHALVADGLPLAAYLEVSRTSGTDVLSLGMRLRALQRLGADDSRLGDRLQDAVASLPAARRSDWFR